MNGEVDTGDPAVVAITFGGEDFCTGTLIAPRAVVTAAHCIDPVITGGIDPLSCDVFLGSDVQGGGTWIHIVDAVAHPGWNNVTLENDIAMLELASPAPVDPVPVNTEPFTEGSIGQPVRLVGFGVTSATSSESGIKRQTTSMVSSYTSRDFSYSGTPGQTCFGDSGGPGFLTGGDGVERLAGVTSSGDEQCMFVGVDTRIDAFWDGFVRPFLENLTPSDCGDDGVCVGGCTPVDPDCTGTCIVDGICDDDCPVRDPDCFCTDDGICDLGCNPVDDDCTGDVGHGQPCVSNRQCVSGLCIGAADDPTFRYCSHICDADSDCAPGLASAPMSCIATEEPALTVCSYDLPSPGSMGWGCAVNGDCRDATCIPFETGALCTRACVALGGGDCPVGYSCQEQPVGADVIHVCLPADPVGGWCAVAPPRRPGLGAALALLLAVALALGLRPGRRA